MRQHMDKILITGSMGFLGSECIRKFKQKGFEVISTDKEVGADIVGNLSDPFFVQSLPQVDVVVNCSAVQYVTKNIPIDRKKFFYDNNVKANKNLSEKYKDVKHFINIGTSMMYKISEKDLSEINDLQGNGVYSISKLDAQTYINTIPNSATVIPCIIGGPGREGLFKGFVKMIDKFPLVLVPGDGSKPVHMVHVEDVAELIYLIYEKSAFGLYNAASINPLSINQWIEVISSKLGKKPFYKFHLNTSFLRGISYLTGYRLLAREQLIMLEKRHVLNIEKSIKLGWVPKYSNDQIVEQTAGYILENYN